MKFLTKTPDSPILTEDVRYRVKQDNRRLLEMLLQEQHWFCAYTETHDEDRRAYNVEHFDPAKKGADDYYNYYAVLATANQRKRTKEGQHEGASFFTSRFFQDEQQLAARVRYVASEHVYEALEGDQEAAALIDYLSLNDHSLYRKRREHAKRLRGLFEDARYDEQKKLDYFRKHRDELSFVTALEAELKLDLSAIVTDVTV